MKKLLKILSLFLCAAVLFCSFQAAAQENDIFNYYEFTSFSELEETFVKKDSVLYNQIKDDDAAGKFVGERKNFKTFFDNVSSGKSKLLMPLYNNAAPELHTEDGCQIYMFSNREMDIPWIWYYCNFDGFYTVLTVGMADVLGEEQTKGLVTYKDYCKKFMPDEPTADTPKAKYKGKYTSITEKTLTLADGTKVEATVYRADKDVTDYWRSTYKFVYKGRICTLFNVYYSGIDSATPEFWKTISFKDAEPIKDVKIESPAEKKEEKKDETTTTPPKNSTLKIVLWSVGGAVVILGAVFGIIIYKKRKKKSGDNNGEESKG